LVLDVDSGAVYRLPHEGTSPCMPRPGVTGAIVALIAVFPSGGCGTNPSETRVADGKEVYARECSRCHMIDGRGYPGVYPNLAGNPIVTLDSPEPTIDTVLEGREAMPGFAGVIPEQKIAQVISYIRHAWGNDASQVTPAQVK
jgi:mono/diheme cytochrome c family protein